MPKNRSSSVFILGRGAMTIDFDFRRATLFLDFNYYTREGYGMDLRVLWDCLDSKAKKKFGEHYQVWAEDCLFPGGCLTLNPRWKTDFIVTVNFLNRALETGVNTFEEVETRLNEYRKEFDKLYKSMRGRAKELRCEIDRLTQARYFFTMS